MFADFRVILSFENSEDQHGKKIVQNAMILTGVANY